MTSPNVPTAPTERLVDGGRRPIVVALMSVIAIVSYNNLAVAAALPDIGDDLGNIPLLPFVITIELLTSAVAVLAAGPIIDGLGARRTFRVAAFGFATTSVFVAVAPTMWALVVGRAVQGIFAGALMTVGVASIGLAIPEQLRPRAFAMTSTVWGVMGVGGPAIAAVMISTVGWRGIFFINVPVTVIAASIGWSRLPDRADDAQPQRVDRVGLALMGTLTAAALAIASYDPLVIGLSSVIVVITATLYVWWSRRTRDPVVRLPHLFARRYRLVHLTSVAVLAGGVGANSFLPLYLRTARGQSTGVAAFSVLFLTIGWSVSAVVSSKLQDKHDGEHVSLLGASMAVPALFATATVVALDGPIPAVYLAFFALGSGVGMVTSTGAALLQSRTTAPEMGRLNAAHQFLRTISITFGIAIVGAVTLAIVDSRTGSVEIVRDALGDESVITTPETLATIGDAYAIALFVMAIVTMVALPSAIGLVRARGQGVTSAP